jgi:hypothetical protein
VSEALDPVRARRARIGRAVAIAQRVGYAALAVAVIAFAIGLSTDFPGWSVTLSITALVAGMVILPVPIVMGYGVRAAEREDRQAPK